MTDPVAPLNTALEGRYAIERELGEGGMKRKAVLVVVFLGLLTCPLAGQLAERLYQQACDGGGMLECNLLGIMYETGEGVIQDLGRASRRSW